MAKRAGTEWITPTEFQALAAKSATPASVRGKAILKDLTPEITVENPEARTVRFRITSGSVDRDKDVISPSGWDLESFRKSPSVLWAHCYDQPPVGRALDVVQDQNGLTSLAEFTPPDMNPFGDMVFKMVKGGFLNMCSVGFRPLEWSYDEERGGVNFARQELLEWSICPVGGNQDALVVARSAGIDLTPLSTWAEETLDGWKKTDSLYVPKAQVEAVYRILSTKIIVGTQTIEDAFKRVGENLADTKTPEPPSPQEPDTANGDATKSLPTDSVPIGKRGRVLSSANETKLRKSLEHQETACQHVKEVLAQLESAPETDALEITEQRSADPEHIVNIEPVKEVNVEIESIPAPKSLPIEPAEIRLAVHDAVKGTLGPAIAAGITASINRLRGRVD
jgi:HK97 family phage prohead protease